jgi:hypothetical protein
MRLTHRGGYTALNQSPRGLEKQKSPDVTRGLSLAARKLGGGDVLEPRTSEQRRDQTLVPFDRRPVEGIRSAALILALQYRRALAIEGESLIKPSLRRYPHSRCERQGRGAQEDLSRSLTDGESSTIRSMAARALSEATGIIS